MKKLMMTLGFAALCGAVLPVHAEIESETVGYNTVTVQGTDNDGNVKWHLLAVQFKAVNGTADTISLSDALGMKNVPAYAGTWKTRSSNAPTVQIYDGVGYVSYYYVAPACSGLEENAWVSGTAKVDVGPTTMLKPGDAVWFTAKNLGTTATSVTFCGAVKSEATATVPFSAGEWSMGSNPYPIEYKINDIVPSAPAYAGTWKTRSSNAPTVQLFDGEGFVSYYYVAPACSGLEKNAWVTGTAKAATADTLAPGAGFWFRNTTGNSGTLTFTFSN